MAGRGRLCTSVSKLPLCTIVPLVATNATKLVIVASAAYWQVLYYFVRHLVQEFGFCVEVLARIPIWHGKMWLHTVGVALKAVPAAYMLTRTLVGKSLSLHGPLSLHCHYMKHGHGPRKVHRFLW